MDIEYFLTHTLTDVGKEEAARTIGYSSSRYEELIHMAFSGKKPAAWRAAWLADYLSEGKPDLAHPYLESICEKLTGPLPVGVRRSMTRLLARYEIPEAYEGIITDLCFDALTRESVPVGIKVYCMEILVKMIRLYPELKQEFMIILEEQMENNSAGFKARAVRLLQQLRTQ